MTKTRGFLIGVVLILMAGVGFSTLQMFVKLAINVSLANKLFFRNFGMFLIVASLVLKKGISIKVPKSEIPVLTARVLFGFLGLVFSFISLKYIILPDSTTIQKLSSIFLMILSALFLKEKFTKVQFISIIISFTGILLIVKPGSSTFSVGYIFSLLGSISAAIAYLCIRTLGVRNKMETLLIMFYFSLFSTLFAMPFAIMNLPVFNYENTFYILGIIFFGFLGQVGVTYAYKFASSREISIFDYVQVLDSSILGIIFLGEVPDFYSVLGYLVIIGSAVFMYKYNLKMDSKG